MGWTSLGCLGGIIVQLSGWLVRPQHPLRHAVAEAWVAASDLVAAMRAETNDGQLRQQNFSEKEGALRATVDRTLRVLEAAVGRRSHRFVAHLDAITQLAARLATRTTAFYTALDSVKTCSGFAPIAPILDSVLRSLANMERSTALTLIMHRPEQILALEIRLRRSTDLIHVLDGRLTATVAAYFILGEPFAGDAVRIKREAERANSQTAASLQRLFTEPAGRRNNFEQAAALTTYNQRLTRTVTVLGQNLDKRERITQPGFARIVAEIGGSIESLAVRLEARQLVTTIPRPNVEMPKGASAEESLVYSQLTKIVAEIEAMAIEAEIPVGQVA